MKDDFRPSAAQPNPTEDRDDSDLISLIESYKKEIWEWKQKESKWLEDKVLLDGTKKLVDQLSEQGMKLKEDVDRLTEENSNHSIINNSHKELNGKLRVRVRELEADNKNLSRQISDHIKKYEDRFREAGL